ncbi:peptidylprolyl isomerase [Methanococcus vannielii]|nr:peptidylprolyl isomerase [Methanococcus vannielii]
MESGKLVKISYDGYVEGKLFDTTNEELAKEEGILNPNMVYGFVTVSVGEKMLIPGLDKAITEMNVGEEKELELSPEEAFGKRDASKVKIVPMNDFKKHNVRPIPGMPVNIDNKIGKIVSANGGRILVDFNHELAGKTLNYKLKLEEVVEAPTDVALEVVKLFVPRVSEENLKITLESENVIIDLPENTAFMQNLQMIKMGIANELIKRLDAKKVSFIDNFVKKTQ